MINPAGFNFMAQLIYTTAPEEYDYAASTRLGKAGEFMGQRLECVYVFENSPHATEERQRYLADYQAGRYASGNYVAMNHARYIAMLADGAVKNGKVPHAWDR